MTFVWMRTSICVLIWIYDFFFFQLEWRVGFSRVFFSYGAPAQQLLPTFPNRARPSRENILFHFSCSVVKELGALALPSHLLCTLALPRLLPSLPFSSPRVLSDLSEGTSRRCVAPVCKSALVHMDVFLCACSCLSAPVCVEWCVCTRLCVAQCVLCLNPLSPKPYKAPRV